MKTKTLVLTTVIVIACTIISCTKEVKEKNTSNELTGKEVAIIEKNESFPIMSFSETEFDFGTITEGTTVEHKFSFTNTGNAPLVIVNAKGSCGCTVPQWPKDPIAPGATADLLVKFNSNGKPNMQTKKVTITANTKKEKEILKIKAMVTPKAKK